MSFLFGQNGSSWVNSGTCTISVASPAVVTFANTFATNQPVQFTTTGTLPTGLSPSTTYFVSATGLSTSSFQVSATVGGASINTTGAGSGTHTCTAATATGNPIGTSGEGYISKTYTLGAAATINGIWVNIVSFIAGQQVVVGLYNGSAGLLAQGPAQTLTGTGLTYFSLSTPYSAAASGYKFGICSDNISGHQLNLVQQLGSSLYQGGYGGINTTFISTFPTLLSTCTASNAFNEVIMYADGGSGALPSLLASAQDLSFLGRH